MPFGYFKYGDSEALTWPLSELVSVESAVQVYVQMRGGPNGVPESGVAGKEPDVRRNIRTPGIHHSHRNLTVSAVF